MNFNNLKHVYLLGIGGIGMSALARYFKHKGFDVSGYDKTSTTLTSQLIEEGIPVHFEDAVKNIPDSIKGSAKDSLLIIYTPAIPVENKELNFFKNLNFELHKRSQVLGLITQNSFTIAVAGTHGKTTTSTLIAHILKSAGLNVSAFLGGISKNYDTNILFPSNDEREITVVEADEYDRSFLSLAPDVSVITSTDADHLDIYGGHEQMKESFDLFAKKVKPGGTLIIKTGLDVHAPQNIRVFYYSRNNGGNFYAEEKAVNGLKQQFNVFTPEKELTDLLLGLPGSHNIENAIAAIAVAFVLDVPFEKVKEGLRTFQGVQRRFDIRVENNKVTYIDDYAHHPEEIRACITSVKNLFKGKKVLGIFQPHLFSRTRDFMEGFAESLSLLDEVILMDIYPARELPIPGITSAALLEQVNSNNKSLVDASQLVDEVLKSDADVILTLGAGDIDLQVKPLENALLKKYKEAC